MRSRQACLLNDLAFLKRCRDKNILPNCVRIRHTFQTRKASIIYRKTSHALLRERIQAVRKDLNATALKEEELEQHLKGVLSVEDWNKLDDLTKDQSKKVFALKKERLMKKFVGLSTTCVSTIETEKTNFVVNLSGEPLSEPQISVLEKGMNFAITPKTIPYEDIICEVETTIQQAPQEKAAEIRMGTARILAKAKPPRPNLTREERKALHDLRKDESKIMVPADKGNATVVMNTTDYELKMEEVLADVAYRKIKNDPTARIERMTKKLIKESDMDEGTKKKISPNNSRISRLYGLPKIHKAGVPLRPIIDARGYPTYQLARHLADVLKSHIGNSPSFVRDSTHFVEILKSINVTKGDMLVSFDVTSLFTKVPIEGIMGIIKKRFPVAMSGLFAHCLTSSCFSWRGNFYEQIDGVAMGSPLSPPAANLFMEAFEEALKTHSNQPKLWIRYVDDTFVIWPHGAQKLNDFLDHLNSKHPNIQFTMEVEENGSLPFLDVMVTKRPDGTLGHKVYRKKTHTNRYLHAESHHAPSQKRGVLKTLTHQAHRICNEEHIKDELKILRAAFQTNGYSKPLIKRSMDSNYKNRDDVPQNDKKIYLPYVWNVTDRIAKLLRKFNIKAVFLAPEKVKSKLRSVKDQRELLEESGIYTKSHANVDKCTSDNWKILQNKGQGA